MIKGSTCRAQKRTRYNHNNKKIVLTSATVPKAVEQSLFPLWRHPHLWNLQNKLLETESNRLWMVCTARCTNIDHSSDARSRRFCFEGLSAFLEGATTFWNFCQFRVSFKFEWLNNLQNGGSLIYLSFMENWPAKDVSLITNQPLNIIPLFSLFSLLPCSLSSFSSCASSREVMVSLYWKLSYEGKIVNQAFIQSEPSFLSIIIKLCGKWHPQQASMRWEEKYSQRLIWRLEERNWRPLPFQNSSNGNCAGIWIYFCHSLTSDRHWAISFFSMRTGSVEILVFSLIPIKIWPQKWPFFRDLFLGNLF